MPARVGTWLDSLFDIVGNAPSHYTYRPSDRQSQFSVAAGPRIQYWRKNPALFSVRCKSRYGSRKAADQKSRPGKPALLF
jgi:hypothetical protein